MTPERWQQIKQVLHSALELTPEQRSAFLDHACSSDPSLRPEIDSLLIADENVRSSFLESPLLAPVHLDKGTRLGSYEILSLIGAGGMGEVYAAHDPRLGRDVAIKVLPYISCPDADLARRTRTPESLPREAHPDQRAIERFQREAHAASALNHPHICTIYDVGEHDGRQFIVMELLEGKTLRNQIAACPLEEQQAVKLGIQIADALSAAHAKGIIHRDIKPANIFITARGEAKLLDFGLSKLTRPLDDLPLAESATEARMPMGTLPYMAPEQLRGEKIDARTDIWGAGAVLYEIVTSQRPFPEDRPPLLIESILHHTPRPPSTLNPKISSGFESIISKALEKDPQRRYQSAGELRADLQRLSTGAVPLAARRRWLAATVAAVVLLALASSLYLLTRRNKTVATAPPIEARRSVAVVGFKNLTAHPETSWLSTALAEMFTTELAAGGQLRTVSEESVSQMKIDLSLSDADSYAKDTLAKMEKILGTNYVVVGSYFDLGKEAGGQVRLDLRVQDARAGSTIATVSETGTEADLLALVSKVGTQLRQRLGVEALSAPQTAVVRASLPQNPEAMRLYAEGVEDLRRFEAVAARDLLLKAVAADPNFALAHWALADAWGGLGYDQKAAEEAKKAFELSLKLSRENQLLVEARYDETTNQRDKAIEVYRTLWNFFSDNLEYGLDLAFAQSVGHKAKDALATVAALRKLPTPARDDPRIDLEDARAHGRLSESKEVMTAASAAEAKARSQGARLVLASALVSKGNALVNLEDKERGMTAYEEAERIYTEAGNRVAAAHAITDMALVMEHQGNHDGAKKAMDSVLALMREAGSKGGEAVSLENVGAILADRGDDAAAMKYWDQALPLFREVDDKNGVAITLNNTAIVLTRRGDLLTAKKRLEESLEIYRQSGSKVGWANAARDAGDTLTWLGEFDAAKKLLEQARAVHEQIHNRYGVSNTLAGLGLVMEFQGDLKGARQNHEQALAIRKQLGEKQDAAESSVALARVSIEQGRPAEAETFARQAVEEYQTERDKNDEAIADTLLAQTLFAQGKTTAARDALSTARPIAEKSYILGLRFKFAIVAAQVRAASGQDSDVAQATKNLQDTLTEATKYFYPAYQFEARLALGEIEMKSGRIPAGRARLAALQQDATSKGFLLIARKAAAAIAANKVNN